MGKFLRAPSGRRRIASVATAVVVAALITSVEVAQPPRADAAIGAIVWPDEFNGAAGHPTDPAKWRYDIGGHGWGNNELQYYTSSTSNAAHDGQGNLVITARRENPANYQCHYGSASTRRRGCSRRQVHPDLRPVRGPHQDPARAGHLAGVLDARQQHRQRRLAEQRRDRHHGEHRPGAEHRARQPAWPRLLRRQRRHRRGHTCPAAPLRRRASTPSRVDWEPNAITCFVDGVSVLPASPPPTPAAMPGFSTIPSS